MFKTALYYEVDTMILGAWGCGVFKNDPTDVAYAFKDVLIKEGDVAAEITKTWGLRLRIQKLLKVETKTADQFQTSIFESGSNDLAASERSVFDYCFVIGNRTTS